MASQMCAPWKKSHKPTPFLIWSAFGEKWKLCVVYLIPQQYNFYPNPTTTISPISTPSSPQSPPFQHHHHHNFLHFSTIITTISPIPAPSSPQSPPFQHHHHHNLPHFSTIITTLTPPFPPSSTSPHQLEPTLQLPPIEGILVLGEPIFWERALQLIVDLLRTHGTPTHLPTTSHKQIPLIVCNFDIEYQSRVTIPRFGNGSFLVCLESVYEKITHRKLVYDVILGKPAELTMRYGEYVLQRAMKKRHGGSIETMYMVGDSHKVDVVASNRYQKYIKKMQHYKNRGLCEREAILKVNKSLPHFRKIPPHPYFIEHPQQVTKMVALLVKTGIYKETDVLGQGGLGDANNFLSHDSILEVPQGIFDDALAAVNYVIQVEKLA